MTHRDKPTTDAADAPADWRDRELLTVPEAGRVLRIGRDAAYGAADRGEIPTIRMGHRRRVPVAWLARLIDGAANPAGPVPVPDPEPVAAGYDAW